MPEQRQPPPGDAAGPAENSAPAAGSSSRGGAGFARLGDLLPEHTRAAARGPRGAAPGRAAAQEAPGSAADLTQKLAAVWADAVGPEVAANARPAQLRDGRLVVSTSSSAWAQTLQLMSPLVIAGLNERLGAEVVKRAVFRHAGWEPLAGGGSAGDAVGGAGAARAEGEPLAGGASGASARGGSPPAVSGGRGGRRTASARPQSRSLPVQPPAATQAPVPAPARAFAPPAPQAAAAELTAEEQVALAELDRQPLDPALKARIREAMLAGFVRAKQDFGRS